MAVLRDDTFDFAGNQIRSIELAPFYWCAFNILRYRRLSGEITF